MNRTDELYVARQAIKPRLQHQELHRSGRIGWMRAAVLGANDGIVSTASLVLGVATAHSTRQSILLAGVSGLISGAMAMAAGEYVSVHSQAIRKKPISLASGSNSQRARSRSAGSWPVSILQEVLSQPSPVRLPNS